MTQEKLNKIAFPNHYGGTVCIKVTPGDEVKDPYEQCVQYSSIEDGIKAHAETYSFNIESELFYQLTKEQQKLWRKEIEQACISGGEVGVELTRDPRYKENLEVKEVGLEKEPSASDRGMAEEIIINLKRVEQDYHLDLTKEMEWLRNKVKKGE